MRGRHHARPMRALRLLACCLVAAHCIAASAAAQAPETRSASASDRTGARPEADDHGRIEPASTRSGMRGWIERQRSRFDNLSSKDHEAGFFPEVGIIVSGSGLAAGGGYRAPRLFDSPLGFEIASLFSYRGYELYRLQAGLIEARTHTLMLRPADAKAASMFNDGARKEPGVAAYLDLRYRDFPRHRFFGVGPASGPQDRTDYLLYGASYDGVLQLQLTRAFGVSARAGVLDLGVGPGRDEQHPNLETVFSPDEAPALIEQPRFLHAGIAAALDTRDEPGNPHRGAFAGVALSRFDGRDGSLFDFTRVVADGRLYLTPFTSRGVVALRALLSADTTADGARVPFYLQQALGGTETLRSFRSYRFQDQALFHATAEYRMDIHRFVQIAPFIDAGTFAPAFSRLRAGDFETSAGVGLRLKGRERVLFRLDWGRGREGQRVSFGTGPLF